ncbi:male sterility protein-domain-containing protein [Ilyonectria sp. MPI-CAGE-AT-0026]|nr:male sterility protein-domain-containing protein [Ilyonectria sp. MPI-CAGE-AT-0026]
MHTVSDANNADSATVILTGSTGSLGSYLLDSLTNQWHVKKIYCLNRAEDGQARQKEVSVTRGLDADWDDHRVEFLHADLSQPGFGLRRKEYLGLLQEATHIIHNQWPVNFNWDLSSFEPHIRGVRHILDFCLDSPRKVEFLFVSTIGTVSHLPTSEPVPERPNHLLSPDLGGYSASKHICELIIEEHMKTETQQRAAICRVGQIAGPVLKDGGMWGKQEWLPTIIASSKHLRLLPSDLGSMDIINWVPVDILAEIILELSGVVQCPVPSLDKLSYVGNMKKDSHLDAKYQAAARKSSAVSVYHAVNPYDVSWSELVPTVADLVGISAANIVPWNQWVAALRMSEQGADLETNPGVKLLDFFESLGSQDGENSGMMPPLATKVSTARSKTMASLSPVGTEWMVQWLKQWGL